MSAHASAQAAPAPEPASLFVKGPPPARELIVSDISQLPANLRLTFVSLQGVVNQAEPRLFLLTMGYDAQWAEWLKDRGDIDSLRHVAPVELIEMFRHELAGQVVVDPALDASINVATMLASLEKLLITHPDYADVYAERYGLPIVHDLRGVFATSGAAYRWAKENLWPRLNHHALAMLHPSIPHLRDFLIQQKVFVWWQGGKADGGGTMNRFEELKVTHEVLREAPVNIPVLGYPWAGEGVGPGEHEGVSLFSQYGKFLLPSDLASNLSVHASARPPRPAALRNAPDRPAPLSGPAATEPAHVNPAKVYLSVLISDGDNIQALLNYFPRYFEGQEEIQGAPRRTAAWSISPAAHDLIPAVVDYYAAKRLPGDYFLTAVSGIGYVYLDQYGKEVQDTKAALDGFLSLTRDYMVRLGLTAIWPMTPGGAMSEEALRLYADSIEFLTAILPDYGQKVRRYEEANRVLRIGDRVVPVFHAMGGESPLAAGIKKALQDAPRPAFAHAFALNWNVQPEELAALSDTLGDKYVLVTPAELARLYLSSLGLSGNPE